MKEMALKRADQINCLISGVEKKKKIIFFKESNGVKVLHKLIVTSTNKHRKVIRDSK